MVTIGGIYALFFREPGGRLAPHDAHAVRVFAYLYFTPLAFGLALVGYALVVWRSFWRAPALMLTITCARVLLLLQDANLARALLARAPVSHGDPAWRAHLRLRGDVRAALDDAGTSNSRNRSRAAFTAIGSHRHVLLGYQYLVGVDADSRAHRVRGVIPQLERLASRFSDNDLVLVEARAASDLHTLALPLSYIYARNVLVLYDSRPDKQAVREFLTWARRTVRATSISWRAAARTCCRPASARSRCRDGAISGAGV